MNNKRKLSLLTAVSCSLVLAACGGSGGSSTVAPTPTPSPSPTPPAGPTDAQRASAATTTAQTNPNCAESALGAFYWEIGDANGVKVSGQVGSGTDADAQEKALYARFRERWQAWQDAHRELMRRINDSALAPAGKLNEKGGQQLRAEIGRAHV